MKLFRFDPEVSHTIEGFKSRNFSISRILKDVALVQRVGCMNIGNDGVVGYHQATCPQLFLVVEGSGWVTGEDRKHIPVSVGQAAFWEANEWHESGSSNGMRAIVIEADELKPEAVMPPTALGGV